VAAAVRLSRLILHAIAVLGVNPKPASPVASRGLTPPLVDGVSATKMFC
jgi:hypothetical protein